MGKKIIVTNLNDKSALQLWDVSGFLPENYLFDAPEDAERIEDLDIDLDKKTAAVNQERKSARLLSDGAIKEISVSNARARALLSSTDWYVIRFVETGVDYSQDIKDARAVARDTVV